MSDWCARLIDQKATAPSTNTGTNAVRSGRWLLPWYGSFSRKTSPGRTCPSKARATDSTAHVIGTLAIGFGWVIPRSCIEGANALTVGFAVSVVSTCVAYWVGVRQAV